MTVRTLLHLNKVKDFSIWLEKQGWAPIGCKGTYEILRMINPKEKPVIIFTGKSPEHASFEDGLFPLVARFLRETR